ncbi:MAG TPA: immunoglobulin-like domain-containing protein [Candidatus Paceibacterota bacterium]|nr:immunoglobulin-like domain-containing protein [Candidatus Paceibacterota bacterium]
MFKRLLHFVQYNNALPIALSAIFLSVSGAFAASPDAREAVYSAEARVRSVDNTYLASLDPATRDFKLLIVSIKEDEEKYYVEYSFNTVDIKEYVWQEIPVTKMMTVSKKELLGGDLGIFVAKELAQLLDAQRTYLAEAKKIALKEGVTQKVVTVEYSGLVGKFLSPTEETFAGYTPTKPDTEELASPPEENVPPPVIAVNAPVGEIPTSVSQPSVPPPPDANTIRSMIEDAVREALARNSEDSAAAVASSGSSSSDSTSTGSSGSGSSSTETPASSDTASSTPSGDAASSTPSETPAEPEPAPDTTPPTITLNGNNPATIEVGSSYVDLGAVVTDNVDQNLGYTATPDSVDTSTTTSVTITYTATDSAGNTATATRTVNVE